MAESTHKLKLIIEAFNQGDATLKQFVGQVKQVGSQVQAAGGETRAAFGSFASIASEFKSGLQSELSKVPLAFAGIGAAAVGAVAGVLSFKVALDALGAALGEGLRDFSHEKLLWEQLSTSWKNAGRAMPVNELRTFIDEGVRLTTFSDDQLMGALRMLSVHGAITDDLMQRSLMAAADLASFMNTDIETAAQYLGRAAEGQLFGLKRMGVELSAATMESRKYEDALKDIERKLGGQAAAAVDRYVGKLQKLKNVQGDLKELAGGVAEPAMNRLADVKLTWLEQLNEQGVKSLESGYLNELSGSLENIAWVLTQKPTGKNWLEGTLETLSTLFEAANPHLAVYLRYLEWIGARKKEAETEGPETVAGPTPELAPKSEEAVRLVKAAGDLRQEWSRFEGSWGDFIEPEQLTALQESVDQLERMAKFFALIKEESNWTPPDGSALEQYEATMQRVQEKLSGQTGPIDWKLEETKAKAYFAELEANSKATFEMEKTFAESISKTKEEAERRVFDASMAFSQRRIAQAMAEYDTILSLKQKQWAKDQQGIEDRNPTQGKTGKALAQAEANRAQELKKLNESRIKEQIELEKKLTDTIREEAQTRYAEIQRYIENIRQLEEELYKVQQANADGLLKLREGTQTEGQKLTSQLDQMREKFQQAVELMPTMPERAKALFQEAQQLAQGLAQNIKALEDNLRNLKDSFDQTEKNLEKLGKTPKQQFAMDVAGVKEDITGAKAAVGKGDWAEAQKKAEAARQKIDSLVSQAEQLYGPEQAKNLLAPLLKESRFIAEFSGGEQLTDAKKTQAEAETTYESAGKSIEQIIGDQITTLKTQMEIEQQLVQALQGLTAAMGGKIEPPAGAQATGAEAGAEIPGAAGATSPYGNIPEGIPPSQAWLYGGAQPGAPSAAMQSPTPGAPMAPQLPFFGQGIDTLIQDFINSFSTGIGTAASQIQDSVAGTVDQASDALQPKQPTGEETGAGEKMDGAVSKFDDSTGKFANLVGELRDILKKIEVHVQVDSSGHGEAQTTWT